MLVSRAMRSGQASRCSKAKVLPLNSWHSGFTVMAPPKLSQFITIDIGSNPM